LGKGEDAWSENLISFDELFAENQDEAGNPIFALSASLELVEVKAERGEFE
jgi:hypothetical protein